MKSGKRQAKKSGREALKDRRFSDTRNIAQEMLNKYNARNQGGRSE